MSAFPSLAERVETLAADLAAERAARERLERIVEQMQFDRLRPLAPKDRKLLEPLLPLLWLAFSRRPFSSADVWAMARMDPALIAALAPLLPGDGVRRLGKLLGRAANHRPLGDMRVGAIATTAGSTLWGIDKKGV